METRKNAINKLKCVHNGKYDYVIDGDFVRSHDKITVICPIHGSFGQEYRHHLNGAGCKSCANAEKARKQRLSREQFIRKAREIHGDKYGYDKVMYVNSDTEVVITCPIHGDFIQTPSKHLRGHGCQKCRLKYANTDEFVSECRKVHGNGLTYEKTNYIDTNHKVTVTCPIHGDFMKYPYQLINRKEGCPKCSKEKTASKQRLTTEQFKTNIIERFGHIYDLSLVDYFDSGTKIDVICHNKYKNGKEHGIFTITPANLMNGYGCPKCGRSKQSSDAEKEITDFILDNITTDIVTNDTTAIGRELDILIRPKKIAIEFDGLYWHSDKVKRDTNFHLSKTQQCEKNGIRLLHIFEDEWENKREIVKSRVLSICGNISSKIYARKCEIREITSSESKRFLNENHIQGNVNSSVRYGLFYNGELVAVMTFVRLRKNLGHKNVNGEYELLRYCSKLNTTVVGGSSKLLRRFIREIQPKRIISYADKRWSNGNLYKKMGFIHVRDSKPNYFYVVNKQRENRFKYRKDALVKQGFDPNKTERVIMSERGIPRIYDCGNMVFEMKL